MASANKAPRYMIGLDVGGTKMRGVLWGDEKVVADFELATPADNLEHFLIMAKAVLDPLIERARNDKIRLAGIGAGIAGVFDSSGRRILNSPNIPIINGVDLAGRLESFFSYPVFLDNDAKCFTRAEALMGAGRGYANVYGLIIGTGIGGGWWLDGKIYSGAHGVASEPGAMIIDISSDLNLEQGFHKLMQNNPGKLSQEAILGDPLAEQAFTEFGQQLGTALANIVNIINPEIFVLGGGVVASADLFLAAAKKEMKAHVNSPEAAKKTKVVVSKLGRDAGAIGAALLV